jgi:HTH-type transcriptional regulator/antitoxin HigA
MSLRYDRIDHFWFTLCHELSHVLHGDYEVYPDSDLVGENFQSTADKPEVEQRADREAAELLIPSQTIEDFIHRIRPLFSKARIIQFANLIRVHPGIIIGQLQRRGEIPYSHSREMLIRVREVVTQVTLTDGWGAIPQ